MEREEAIKAMDYDVSAIESSLTCSGFAHQIILWSRQENNVGILARVPLASGLLTGKFTADTQFGKDDHRTTNRNEGIYLIRVKLSLELIIWLALKQQKMNSVCMTLAATALRFILALEERQQRSEK